MSSGRMAPGAPPTEVSAEAWAFDRATAAAAAALGATISAWICSAG